MSAQIGASTRKRARLNSAPAATSQATADALFQIYYRDLQGKTKSLMVPRDATIKVVLEMICKKEGFDQQVGLRLLYSGKALDASQELSHYGIKPSGFPPTLHLVGNLPSVFALARSQATGVGNHEAPMANEVRVRIVILSGQYVLENVACTWRPLNVVRNGWQHAYVLKHVSGLVLKQHIEKQFKVPIAEQCLVMADDLMLDDKYYSAPEVSSDDCLTVVLDTLRLPANPQTEYLDRMFREGPDPADQRLLERAKHIMKEEYARRAAAADSELEEAKKKLARMEEVEKEKERLEAEATRSATTIASLSTALQMSLFSSLARYSLYSRTKTAMLPQADPKFRMLQGKFLGSVTRHRGPQQGGAWAILDLRSPHCSPNPPRLAHTA